MKYRNLKSTKSIISTTYGKPQINPPWKRLRALITVCLMLHVLGILGAFCILFVAVHVRLSLGRHLDMVAVEGEGIILPAVLAFAALVSGSLHTPQTCYLYRITSREVHKCLNRSLCVAVFFNGCWALLLLVAVAGIVVHTYFLHDKVRDGLLSAMASYKNNSKSKRTIDTLQFRFQCCGCDNHTDWFTIPWFDADLANLADDESDTRDDVPFSCCSIARLYPCMHEGILGRHRNTDYSYNPGDNLSISTTGCHNAVNQLARSFAFVTSLGLLGLAVYEATVCAITKLIQTGHSIEYKFDRKKRTPCWLFSARSKSPKQTRSKTPKKQKDQKQKDKEQKQKEKEQKQKEKEQKEREKEQKEKEKEQKEKEKEQKQKEKEQKPKEKEQKPKEKDQKEKEKDQNEKEKDQKQNKKEQKQNKKEQKHKAKEQKQKAKDQKQSAPKIVRSGKIRTLLKPFK